MSSMCAYGNIELKDDLRVGFTHYCLNIFTSVVIELQT